MNTPQRYYTPNKNPNIISKKTCPLRRTGLFSFSKSSFQPLSLGNVDPLLFDTGLLASKRTQVVQLGTTHLTDLVDGNALDS